MALRRPTKDDLHKAASVNHLDLSDEEVDGFLSLMPGIFELMDELDQLPVDLPTLEGVVRDPGTRPDPRDDPYNAVLRRCSVKGPYQGKLSGMRVGLKDNVSVAGIPMTCGSRILSGYVPDIDATIVVRLLKEGAEIVAMLNMDDMAWSGGGDTSIYGRCLNPHNPDYQTGGSSAGSGAALYYDYIDMTIGGDQGGSIRMPSAWCGVVGLKPTFGLVPYTGIVGGENTIDHTGPMARTTEQVALMLEVIAGKDDLDPRQGEVPVEDYTKALDGKVEGLRIGVVKEGFGLEASQKEVDDAVRKALRELAKLKVETREVSIPMHNTTVHPIYQGINTEGGGVLLRDQGRTYGWEGFYHTSLAEALGRNLKTNANDLSPDTKFVMLVGTYLSDYYQGRLYGKAQNLRKTMRDTYDEALKEFDALAMPTVPVLPFKYDPDSSWVDRIARNDQISLNTGPFNATGHPALSVPCGKVNGLPVGLMLIGKHFQDATLLKIAHAFEKNVDWESI